MRTQGSVMAEVPARIVHDHAEQQLRRILSTACRADGGSGRPYQLDFFTPGIRPRLAKPRKQMRQIPNFP
jgi:hypothetical protein